MKPTNIQNPKSNVLLPNSRRYPKRPILGVGAIVIEFERVLLVELGETLADAVRRETLEETGLEIEPLSVVEIFERIMRDEAGAAEYHYVLVDYVCRVTGGELTPGDDV